MKRILAILMAMLILCAASASAETRYILPDGWYYNAEGQIVAPSGYFGNSGVYDSIWDEDCISQLQLIDWGYGDADYMEKYLRLGTTPELGDDSVSFSLLICTAVLALAGAAFCRKKANHAA